MTQKKEGKVILVTFAGRRDRMEILCNYVRKALINNVIDEWHVWAFARKAEDTLWIRETFQRVRLTPNFGNEYFDSGATINSAQGHDRFQFEASALSDVHVGLLARNGGQSFEIVLGGWGNEKSVLRTFDTGEALLNFGIRNINAPPAVEIDTPKLIPEWKFTHYEITVGREGIGVALNNGSSLFFEFKIDCVNFQVYYRSSHGANVEWRFPAWLRHKEFLFLAGERERAGEELYLQFYRHICHHQAEYENDIFLKCDDDIVYIDVDKLPEFLMFRKNNPQYFAISANVVNNGVCAHFQQRSGFIPKDVVELELPAGGYCGSLWGSSEKASLVHQWFINNKEAFVADSETGVIWDERLSINFIALLGMDFVYISDYMEDDERYISYQGRWRSRKHNFIYFNFLVAHLSFYVQDDGLDVPGLLRSYKQLEVNEASSAGSN